MAATTPTSAAPAELGRRLVEAVGRKDLDAVRPFWTEETVDVFHALGREVRGPQALTAFFEQTFAAYPDFRMEVLGAWGDETHATVRWRITGTFSGAPFEGIEPTGRRVELLGIDAMEFRDGKLVRNDVYYDGATFARQIGMLPPMGSPADKAMTAAFNATTALKKRLRRSG